MLTVTDAAAEHLSGMLDEANAEDNMAARLVPTDQGLELALDAANPSDQTFEHGGKTVLVIDEKLGEMLAGRTLDVQTTEQGTGLTLQ